MIYETGNKFCVGCENAKITPASDLDIAELIYEPDYSSTTCHYCEHCYDNIEKNG